MIYDLGILSVSLLARLRNILFIVSLCPLSYGSFSNERYIGIISRTDQYTHMMRSLYLCVVVVKCLPMALFI